MNRIPIGIVLMGFLYLSGAVGCASEEAAKQPTSVGPSVSPATPEIVSVGAVGFPEGVPRQDLQRIQQWSEDDR